MVNLITLSAMVRSLGFVIVPLVVIRFYRGKTTESVLNAQKNIRTNIVAPILSTALVIFLLVEYNWKAQFGVANAGGQVTGASWYAIVMTILGSIVLPPVMFFASRKDCKASK